jgi:hypothetical protein
MIIFDYMDDADAVMLQYRNLIRMDPQLSTFRLPVKTCWSCKVALSEYIW